jgi:hypothetical protein
LRKEITFVTFVVLPSDNSPSKNSLSRWIIPLLVLGIVATYQGLADCSFIVLDDPSHTYQHPVVVRGLSWDGISSAFTTSHANLWVPLTTVSFMVDASLFGISPMALHLENLAWHAAAAVLLYLSLRALTGSTWKSALVAALFGLHPINVESVAWITERKNVLCAFFTFASLRCWASYVQRGRVITWFSALILFAGALLAKPMAVTVPCALLLLDAWPLERWSRVRWWKLIAEKLPFFALSFVTSRMALWAASGIDVTPSFQDVSLASRLTNAVTSIGQYIGDLLWPSGLAILYPHPVEIRWWPALPIGVGLVGVTALTWFLRRSHPWLIVGWLWFGGMLFPSLGLIQAGAQARADRFTYLAQVGFWFALVWSIARWWPARMQQFKVAGAVAALLGLAAVTARQVLYWRDSRTLFHHSLAVTGPHAQILDFLAASYSGIDDRTAIKYWLQSLKLIPGSVQVWVSVGDATVRLGETAHAEDAYHRAALLEPANADYCFKWGMATKQSGQLSKARNLFEKVIQLDSRHVLAHVQLAELCERSGEVGLAMEHLQAASAIDPKNTEVANALARLRTANPGIN